jgi:putative membrane protein
MMYIDWVQLLLVNMAAGFFLLAYFVYAGLGDPDHTPWAPGFLMVGAVAVFFGALMGLTWPLPGPYNVAFGGPSVLLGVIFLGAGVAMARGWSLTTVACYAFFAGWVAVVVGLRVMQLRLTLTPVLSGIGFILSGAAGVLAAPTLAWMRNNRPFRTLSSLVLAAAGAIWAVVAYGAYWHHLQGFSKWVPLLMRGANGQP